MLQLTLSYMLSQMQIHAVLKLRRVRTVGTVQIRFQVRIPSVETQRFRCLHHLSTLWTDQILSLRFRGRVNLPDVLSQVLLVGQHLTALVTRHGWFVHVLPVLQKFRVCLEAKKGREINTTLLFHSFLSYRMSHSPHRLVSTKGVFGGLMLRCTIRICLSKRTFLLNCLLHSKHVIDAGLKCFRRWSEN